MMKCLFSFTTVLVMSAAALGQTQSTFEGFLTEPNSKLNGSGDPMGTAYTDGNAVFNCFYDTSFGGYWSGGFAISNVVDSTTGDFTNLYGARPGSGYQQSSSYAVSQNNSVLKLQSAARNEGVSGFYITNTTYAYYVIRDGNQFTKPGGFGGQTGNDPDFFALSVKAYNQGTLSTDSALFYLADYRFADNSQDYIVKTWKWFDLSQFTTADSLLFELHSSDVGQFGINTPTFFAMDNFETNADPVSIGEIQNETQLAIWPNPSAGELNLPKSLTGKQLKVFNLQGTLVAQKEITSTLDFENLEPGMYLISIPEKGLSATWKKF
ncbi:MAG: DUF4465 domain-containing protein [Luteibaculum sp.]